MIKKFLYLLLGLSLCFILTGCFDKEETKDTDSDENSKSRLAELYSTFDDDKGIHMEYETTYNGKVMKLDMYRKNGKIYSKSDYSGNSSITLILDGYSYNLLTTTKTGTKRALTDEQKDTLETSSNYAAIENYANMTDYKTGKMEADGKEYYYEEYTVSDSKIRFLFDGKEIKYNITYKDGKEESRLKYNAFDSNVDESVFKVPSDYKITEI